MDAARSKEFVLDFFQDLASGAVDKAWESLADDASWELMARSADYPYDRLYTKQSYRGLMAASAGLFPTGLPLTIKEAIAEADRVAVEAETCGTAWNGKLYNNFYHFKVELKDGKIQAIREYLDSGLAIEVLGRKGDGSRPG